MHTCLRVYVSRVCKYYEETGADMETPAASIRAGRKSNGRSPGREGMHVTCARRGATNLNDGCADVLSRGALHHQQEPNRRHVVPEQEHAEVQQAHVRRSLRVRPSTRHKETTSNTPCIVPLSSYSETRNPNLWL